MDMGIGCDDKEPMLAQPAIQVFVAIRKKFLIKTLSERIQLFLCTMKHKHLFLGLTKTCTCSLLHESTSRHLNSFTCTFLTHALTVLRSDRNYEKNEQWTGNANPQTSQWSTLQIWRFGLLKSYSPTVSFPLHPLLCIHVWKGHQIFNPRHLFLYLVCSFVLSSRRNC
jgi:hypothetical protein